MDSLTQLTFGAACGEAVLGQKGGRKALAWGAVLATLPDLDVFIPLGGPVNDFVYHRGFSHSLVLLALIAPILTWLISKPDYVFRFKVARLNDRHPQPIDDARLKTTQDWRRLAWVWKRIWMLSRNGLAIVFTGLLTPWINAAFGEEGWRSGRQLQD